MQYETWNFENDAIVTNKKPLFPPKTAMNYMGTAYAVETENGIFYQKIRNDGCFNLVQVTQTGEKTVMHDITVVASDMKYSCIIVHCDDTGEYFLIDTRGIFFLLEVKKERASPAMYSMHLDRKSGFYEVGTRSQTRWMIRGVSKEKQFMTMLNSAPTGEWTLNPKFKSLFSKKMAGDYLYLTILNSKKGKIIRYLIDHELPYEELPNLFLEDNSQNIRIPINDDTMKTRAMNFLMVKYYNTYAIAGIPVETFMGTLDLGKKIKEQLYVRVGKASDSQYAKVMSLINTMKMLYEVETDLDLYKKLFKRLIGLFPKACDLPYENSFETLRLPYPEGGFHGVDTNREVLQKNLDYINSVLRPDRPIASVEALDRISVSEIYREVYEAAMKNYKQVIAEYENSILSVL